MRKQFIACVMATTVLLGGTAVMAQGQESQIVKEQQMRGSYITKEGKITSIEPEKDVKRICVGTYEEGIIFSLSGHEVIIDGETGALLTIDELKEQMQVMVVYPKNAPMGMSLPAYCSAQTAIIVMPMQGAVAVGFFNDALVNEENTLALNIYSKTRILNTKGEKRIFTAEDIKNKDVVVIYTNTTRSMPPQTSPNLVLILPDEGALMTEELSDVADEEKVSFLPLREMAMQRGYSVTWQHKEKRIILSKAEEVIKISLCDDMLIVEGKEQLPFQWIDQKVFVTQEMLDYLS